jgi:purine-binding chemotaxis protein CheW
VSTLHVAFRVGDSEYAIAATDVLHLEPFTEATRIPGAPAFLAGLVQVRGKLVPVVDLRARFGLPPAPHTLDNRIIIVTVGARVAGLLVDSARDVLQLDEAAFQPTPAIVDRQATGFIQAVTTIADRMLLVVSASRLIEEEAAHA